MRDVNRIPIFCYALAQLWEHNFPDLRFGQLISILTKDKDIFYLEEDEILQLLDKKIQEMKLYNDEKEITNQIKPKQISLFDKTYIYSGKIPEVYLKENENE